MRDLIRFFIRYHFVLLFVLLELIAFATVVGHHKDGGRFLHSAQTVTGPINQAIDDLIGFYHLKSANKELAESTAKLLNASVHAYRLDTAVFKHHRDSVLRRHYEYIAANVIKNSTHKHRNFFTIDKGKANGIDKDMAVIAPNGVVGIIKAASEHFALGISLLNVDAGISGKLKKSNHFGSISWDGRTTSLIQLNGIQSHVKIQQGDSVVTSGFSSLFPEGLLIGTLSDYNSKAGTNFYTMQLKLAVDFTKLKQVFVVKNLMREEQLALEEELK